jgi:hypothetical protein
MDSAAPANERGRLTTSEPFENLRVHAQSRPAGPKHEHR